MKAMKLCLPLLCMSVITTPVIAEEAVINIYNWSDYISPDALEQFTANTGIKVNYDVYDSNEVLEAKLMAGGSGYDLVMPTGSYFERQVQAKIYQAVDKTKLTNLKNLDQGLADKVTLHDPGNLHNIPYAWGTIGIGYNQAMLTERLGEGPFDSLDLLFDPKVAAKLADCGIAVLDSPAEIMAIANNYLGLDPNSESKKDLASASKMLSAVQPYYKYFHSSQYISDLANGEICVALGYNGDILQAQSRAVEANQGVDVHYRIPKEGTQIWFDVMGIPADAPHPEAAHKFIDFVLQADTAAGISNFVFYAVPNTAAEPLVDSVITSNPGIYPPQAVKDRLFTQTAHAAKFDRLLTRAWSNIKTGR